MPKNAYFPMDVTEFGMMMDVRLVHLANAESPMEVTVYVVLPCSTSCGIVMFPATLVSFAATDMVSAVESVTVYCKSPMVKLPAIVGIAMKHRHASQQNRWRIALFVTVSFLLNHVIVKRCFIPFVF